MPDRNVTPTLVERAPRRGSFYQFNGVDPLLNRLFAQEFYPLKRSYGYYVAIFVCICFSDIANQYYRVERWILQGKDEDALAFRHAIAGECNIISVTGAIIAQVAITGLSLPDLSATHWMARAFLLFAVASGCLCVYYCCVLQRITGKFYSPRLIRAWLTLPPRDSWTENRDKRASLAAIFIVTAPFIMVKASIFSLLTGLTICHGFTWLRGLDTDAAPGDSRNVFVIFVIGTGTCIVLFFLTFSSKSLEIKIQFSGDSIGQLYARYMLPDDTQGEPRSGRRFNEASGDLAGALNASAAAHALCAEVDRTAALEVASARLGAQADTTHVTMPQNDVEIETFHQIPRQQTAPV